MSLEIHFLPLPRSSPGGLWETFLDEIDFGLVPSDVVWVLVLETETQHLQRETSL